MKLYEAFDQEGFHTTVLTTFGVDFDAFESIALNRLRGAGCRNVVLIGDAGMLALALAEGRPPKFAGIGYLVAKSRAASGVFHPKVIVQLGKNRGRLIVTSANATAPGLTGNLELATTIDCNAEDSSECRLVSAGWKYVLRFLDERQHAVQEKLRWASERTDWLDAAGTKQGEEVVQLSDGSAAAFLAADRSGNLARSFVALVSARRRIERLVVLSPYWDEELSALQVLRNALHPRATILMIDTQAGLFPVAALPKTAAIQVSELQMFDTRHFPKHNSRFVHAKMIVATAGGTDHILVGSANCTTAALGDGTQPGINEEACLYRRLPAGRIFEELGLEPLLDKQRAVAAHRIAKRLPQDRLPLDKAKKNDPGTFELAYDRLSWWPQSQVLAKAAVEKRVLLELLDATAEPIRHETLLLPGTGPERTFQIKKCERRPAFARFRHAQGAVTGIAIVACIEELRTQTRDALTAKAERAIRELEADEDESLWLLDVIGLLAAPQGKPAASMSPRTQSGKKQKNDSPVAHLDYESFMRGRRRQIVPSEAERNSLGGTHVSLVRAALNRLLGLAAAPGPSEAGQDLESNIASVLDTGDETGEAENALEHGFDPRDPRQSPKAAIELAKRRRRADATAIAYAVDDFSEDIREPDRVLDAVDMLRLRAILTIIAVAGWPGLSAPSYKPSQIQVLPRSDSMHGETWPRLIGRLLAPVFAGPKPAIKKLKFEKSHDRLPDDVLEALACCIWSVEAAATATRADPACCKLAPFLERLAASVGALLGLSKEERAAPSFVGVIEGLDKRFGARLQLPSLKPVCTASEQIKVPTRQSKQIVTA
jgi:hypothetical protein